MQGNMTQLWSAISVESRDFIMNGRGLWWKVDERLRYVMAGQDFNMVVEIYYGRSRFYYEQSRVY